MIEKGTFFQRFHDDADIILRRFLVDFFGSQQRIAEMFVPTAEKLVRGAELSEIAVKSRLSRPIDEFQHVFQTHRAFDGDSAMALRGFKDAASAYFPYLFMRNVLSVFPGPQKAAAAAAKQLVYAQQKRPRAVRLDLSASRGHRNLASLAENILVPPRGPKRCIRSPPS